MPNDQPLGCGSLGQMTEFNPDNEDFANYVERLTSYFVINGVPDSKRSHMLITLIGAKTYGILKDLI